MLGILIISIQITPRQKVTREAMGRYLTLRECFVIHHTDFHTRVFRVGGMHAEKSIVTVWLAFVLSCTIESLPTPIRARRPTS